MTLKLVLLLFFTGLDLPSLSSSAPPEALEKQTFLIERVEDRVTKKPFGLYVSPSNSPVSPERFSGYHTGVDFEAFEDELEIEIPIHAMCQGSVRFADWVKGYGGVLIQDCILKDTPVTVLYGHLDLSSISFQPGDALSRGDFLANLGEGFSIETDGERKHLHLAIHQGDDLEFRGYVSTEGELEEWMDPLAFF